MGDEYAGFVLLNLFDLCLTAAIFQRGGREVNPVGYYVMLHYGLGGYTLFKFALVMTVVVTIETLNKIRPRTARGLMNCGNLVYLGIVLWECVLMAFH
jgi:hypothetical protein